MNTVDFSARVLRTLSEHQMIQSGDTVIVALSGGGDSMALFHFLYLHRKPLGIRLRAAHVNHGIRGLSADADEAFVRRQCAQYGVELDVCSLSLGADASENEARRARYDFFDGLCAAYHAKLATAHTRSDQAETVLLRLARGTLLEGAAGIPYVRGAYIRPLLDVGTRDVRDYLAQSGVPFCTDETNEGDAYARNRIRHRALPALESVCAGAQGHLSDFAQDVREAADYLDAQARALLCGARRVHPAEVLDVYDADALLSAPRAVRRAALRAVIEPYGEIFRTRLESCEMLLKTGGTLNLNPDDRFCVRQGLARVEPIRTARCSCGIPFSVGEFPLWDGRILKIEKIPVEKYEKMGKEAQNPLFSCADYDRIKYSTLLRGRNPDDRFARPRRGRSRQLGKILNENRLTEASRAALVVCARGNEVLWASGFGASAEAVPRADTENIAVITIGKRGTI